MLQHIKGSDHRPLVTDVLVTLPSKTKLANLMEQEMDIVATNLRLKTPNAFYEMTAGAVEIDTLDLTTKNTLSVAASCLQEGTDALEALPPCGQHLLHQCRSVGLIPRVLIKIVDFKDAVTVRSMVDTGSTYCLIDLTFCR